MFVGNVQNFSEIFHVRCELWAFEVVFFLSKMHISLFSFTFDFDFQHFVTFFKFSCNLVMITQVTIAHFKWNDPYMNGHWSKPKHDDQRITVAVLYSSVPRC